MNNSTDDTLQAVANGITPTIKKNKGRPKKLSDVTPAVSATFAPINSVLPIQMAAHKQNNIESLRIPANFGGKFAVNKLLVNIPVRKPNKSVFFRVRDGEKWEFLAYILENKEAGETYLLTPEVAEIVPESARPVRLHVAIDRRANPFLIPLVLPGEDGRRNPWHESLAQGINRSKHKWVRIVANMGVGAYDLYEAQGELGKPEWPEHTMNQLVEIAFRGKIISDIDHPVIRELLGQI